MDVYDSSGQIEVQSKDDESPLTKADIAAHKTIIRGWPPSIQKFPWSPKREG